MQTDPITLNPSEKKGFKLPIFLLFTVPPLLWAGNFIVGRAVRNDIPPGTLTFYRWLIALIIILPLAWPHIRRDHRLYRAHAGRIVTISLLGIWAFSLLVYFGLHHTSGTNGLLLNSCIPVLIMLFSALFFKAKLTWMQITGLVVSCLGVLIIIFKGDPQGFMQLDFSSGDLMLLAAMTSFALYTLLQRKIPAQIDRMGLLGIQVMVTLVATAPFLFWEMSTLSAVTWNKQIVSAVFFLGVCPSFISYLLYTRCIEAVGAARAGFSIHLIPVFGVVLSVLFLGEQVQGFHIMGITAILAGVHWAGRRHS